MSNQPAIFAIDDSHESPPITDTLDSWYLDMRKNFMVKLHSHVLEATRPAALHDNRENESIRLHDDVRTMRQMLGQYDHIIDQKDQTEENLTKALNLLYDKTIAYRYFYRWRFVFIEQRRRAHGLALSQRFYDGQLKRVRCSFVLHFSMIDSSRSLEILQQLETSNQTRLEGTRRIGVRAKVAGDAGRTESNL